MTDFLLTADQLRAREGVKWRRHPADVLPAFVADMDFAVSPAIRESLERLVDLDDTGYGPMEDEQRLGGAFARRMRDRYGWEVDPELVISTIEVVQGIVAAIVALTEPGDGIVVQTPVYPPFLTAVAGTNRRLVENPLVDDGPRFVVNAEGLRAAVDPGTRMILLCNPHNPSGRVFTRTELEAIAAVAIDHDLVIVSDEIHSELLYPGMRHIPIASLGPDVAARTLTLTSATKAFNIAGLRCALAALGSPQLRDRFRRAIPDHLLGRPNRFGVEATIAAWAHGDEWLESVLGYLDRNRRRVAEVAAGIGGLVHHPPEGTYLAWLDCGRLELPAASPFQFFLERAKVALADGADFGSPGRGCVRLNFATSAEILEQILDRMLRALRS
ncbi:MAG TPA: PatB family C-S lyase [Candidatus Udaeobacter sp.]|nr:PatB family C-S lyase [Candidatus Udaeobacter sp.]